MHKKYQPTEDKYSGRAEPRLRTDSELTIRRLTLDQIPDFHRLRLKATQSFPKAFGPSYEQLSNSSIEQSKRLFLKTWGSQDNFIASAWCDKNLIGTIGLQRVNEGNAKHIAVLWNSFVLTGFQGQGVGKALMSYVINNARFIHDLEILKLETSSSQVQTIKFYQSFNFQVFGKERNGLKVSGEYIDVIHMALSLYGRPEN